jgi:hypothetical protein
LDFIGTFFHGGVAHPHDDVTRDDVEEAGGKK